MGNTENSPEYKILDFLRKNNQKNGYAIPEIRENTQIDSATFNNCFPRIIDNNHVDKTPLNKFVLNKEGRIRLEKMDTDVYAENLQRNIDKSNRTTKYATSVIALFTVESFPKNSSD